MKDLTFENLNILLQHINQDDVKIHLFKFLHDLKMLFGNEECSNFSDFKNSNEEKCQHSVFQEFDNFSTTHKLDLEDIDDI